MEANRSRALNFFCEDIGFAANDAVRFRAEAVELKIQSRGRLGQLGEKAVVVRDPLAVPVEAFGMGHCTRDRYLGSVAARSGLAVKEFVSD